MKSLYDSVLSGIVSHLDKQINLYQDQKQAAVDALEAEKEAALAAYDAQIEAIDAQIKAKNKQISVIQKEIDAINDAAEARERDLELQKSLYDLEKARNQRTQFILKDGQMVYQTDPEAERDAKERVSDAEREKQIADLEKQIDLIQEQIDALEEEKEAIQAMRDETEKYYDQLIKSTEEYWDALIKALEDYKSRWEELQELQEEAEFRANLESLGLNLDDILNMSDEAFAQFKNDYVGILADIYDGNESMTNALAETLGMSAEQMGSYLQSTAGQTELMVTAINNLGGPLDSLSNSLAAVQSVLEKGFTFKVDDSGLAVLEAMGDKAKEATESIPQGVESALKEDNIGKEAAAQYGDDVVIKGYKEEGLDSNSPSVKAEEATKSIPEGVEKALNEDTLGESAAEAYGQRIIDKLKEVFAERLGESELDLSKLFPENFDLSNAINQFALLADAIKKVADALGVGENGVSSGIAQAIADLGAMTLGSIASEDAVGEGIIGQFSALGEAVKAVTSAIGSMGGEEEGASAEETAGTLVGAIQALKEVADTYIGTATGGEEGGGEEGEEGEGTVISDFEAMKTAVEDNINTIGNEESEESDGTLVGNMMYLPVIADESIRGEVIPIFEELLAMIRECVAECAALAEEIGGLSGTQISIKGGSSGGSKGGSIHGSTQWQGTAHAGGEWGLDKSGTSLVGELGPEIVVRGSKWFTVGQHGAEFANLRAGDIIFNHKQSEGLLKHGKINSHGRAFAEGGGVGSYGGVFDNFYKLQDVLLDQNTILADVRENTNRIVKDIGVQNTIISHGGDVNLTMGDVIINSNGTTSEAILQEVGTRLTQEFEGLSLKAYQRVMKR